MRTRATSEDMDRLLGNRIDVLDDGFVEVVDYMGNDAAVVQAARVSYGEGTKTVREDEGLIRYLMRNRHTTPFEMCRIKLLIRCPMDVWRQWIRHRTASVNEYSTRYSVAIDSAAKTDPAAWRSQSGSNRQGSEGVLDVETGLLLSAREREFHALAREIYDERLEADVARELARKDLPLSTYTEAYWSMDLHNLLHFLALRMDQHAQAEIRAYANAIGSIVAAWVPLTWGAFCDYRLGAASMSRVELELLRLIVANSLGADGLARIADDSVLTNREAREFCAKLGVTRG